MDFGPSIYPVPPEQGKDESAEDEIKIIVETLHFAAIDRSVSTLNLFRYLFDRGGIQSRGKEIESSRHPVESERDTADCFRSFFALSFALIAAGN